MAQPREWKYRVRNVRFALDYPRRLKEVCDTFGKGGWELVSVTHSWNSGYTLFFKRECSAASTTKVDQ